jgi:hypothetical protein
MRRDYGDVVAKALGGNEKEAESLFGRVALPQRVRTWPRVRQGDKHVKRQDVTE